GYHLLLAPDPAGSIRETTEARVDDLCRRLRIPWKTLDFSGEFERLVVGPFLRDYQAGKTPNPCALCNLEFKAGRLLEAAVAAGAAALATGHYARLEYGERAVLKKNRSPERDESYFLGLLRQEQLKRLVFPLGTFSDARAASELKRLLPGFEPMPVSQEACFTAGGGLRAMVRRLIPDAARPGDIVDESGTVLGRHPGICFFTVGQRRGLGPDLAGRGPFYVTGIDASSNRLVVGSREELLAERMTVSEINWVSIPRPSAPLRVSVKIRNTHPAASAELVPREAGGGEVRFDRPQEAVTPGQLAVFYREDLVAGAGFIRRAGRE
nr:tRNA 2-thiouridine(34) synthase MnmA [bacterium]